MYFALRTCEQLGFLYAEKYGLEVFCFRIGNVTPAPVDKWRLSNRLSTESREDKAQNPVASNGRYNLFRPLTPQSNGRFLVKNSPT